MIQPIKIQEFEPHDLTKGTQVMVAKAFDAWLVRRGMVHEIKLREKFASRRKSK